MGAAIVAHRDTPPVFDFGKHVLDFVPLFVESFVVIDGLLPVLGRRNAGLDASLAQSLTQAVAVVATVADQRFGKRQLIEQKPGAFMIAHLAFRQKQDHGLALAVADGVELGIQPPFGSSDAAGGPPFFRRLAAVRCTFR